MAITFDASTKRIILDTTSISAAQIYSRWVDWCAIADNVKYGMVFRQVGGDDLGNNISIPPYFFLQNGWRIRPMEANQDLAISGNLFVEGGGNPIVPTLGTYQVNVTVTVPMQAQAVSPAAISAADISNIANAVLATMKTDLTVINHGVQLASILVPHDTNLSS